MNAPREYSASLLICLMACGLLFGSVSCGPSGPQPGDEMAGVTQFVANGSFEEMEGENPKGWRPRNWQRGEATFAVEPTGRSGGRSVMISS
jgi:hypothetical protein